MPQLGFENRQADKALIAIVSRAIHMLNEKGINQGWKKILHIMSTHIIQIIELPTDKKTYTLENLQSLSKAPGCEHT